jgi:hypothetical protein
VLSTPYVASLRIFEPITAFPAADRLRWAQLSDEIDTRAQEQLLAMQRLIVPEPPALRPDGAHLLDVDGVRYICPWSTASRCWSALEDFKEVHPSTLTAFFVSPALEEVITAGSENFEERVPHIITQNWKVPPRWLALFEPADRNRGYSNGVAYSKALTPLSKALERCKNSFEIVLQSFGDGYIAQEIEELIDWMELFHPESLIELDYGGLAGYLDYTLKADGQSGIEDDGSIEDLIFSLAGLASGDGAVAGEGYERLMSRWRPVEALEAAM